MAEKGFGVKEVNLIGASGTPTITSPNNLNLNAVNVAISTNASIGGNLTVSGTVGIAGTLTYEDVTNIDSVGLITARSGILVKDDATFETANSNNIVFDKSDNALEFGNGVKSVFNNNLQIYNDGNNRFKGSSGGMFFGLPGSFQIGDGNFSNTKFEATGTHAILYSAGVKVARSHENRFEVGNPEVSAGIGATISTIGNAQFVGVVTASSFIGSGANLTGIAVTEAPVTDYTITGDGSHYYFHGGGVDETAGDPDLYLIRGQKYRFNNTTGSGHPFEFRIADGGSAYSNGVSGDDEGVQFFTVPYDAPAKIFYQCTIHGGMVGNIYIRGAGGQNDNIGLTTFSGDITIKSSTPLLRLTDTDTSGPLNVDIESVSGDLYLDTGSIHRDVIISNSGRANEVARFTGDGKMGLGTANPIGDFEIFNNSGISSCVVRGPKALLAIMGDSDNSGASETDASLMFTSDSHTVLNSPLTAHGFEIALINEEPGSGLRFHDGTANAERLRITSSGNLIPGADSTYYLGTASVRWAQVNTDYLSAGISNTNGSVASFKGGNYNQVNVTHSGNSGWGLLLTNSDSTSNGGYHESTSGNNNSCAIVNVNNDALYLATNNQARWRVEHDGHFIPASNGAFDMGSTGKRVRRLYASNSTNTSDRNLKNTITESDLGLDFICKLKPVSYKWNQKEGESLDTKTHYGLISQDVEEVIIETGKTLDDFGAIDKPDGDPMGLSYNEFISPLIKAIQEQKAEIDALKSRVAALEGS